MIPEAKRRKPAHLTAQAFKTAPTESKLPEEIKFAFEISNVRSVSGHRTLVGIFDVTLPGVVIADCRVHLRNNGLYLAGSGRFAAWLAERWQTHVTFDDDLGAAILEAAEARLVAEDGVA